MSDCNFYVFVRRGFVPFVRYAPVAQTCTFTLKVPEYSSLEVAERQLRRAIVEEGMHLD